MNPSAQITFFGSLRGRLIMGVAVVHAVLMSLFVFDSTVRQRAMLLENQTAECSALTQALAASAAGWIASSDVSGLQELVESQSKYPELRFALIADFEGRVLAHTDRSKRGLFLQDLPAENKETVMSRSAALVDIVVPANLNSRPIGWARVGISRKQASQELALVTALGILYALAAIVIGSLLAWWMGLRITRRLYAIQDTMAEVRSGNEASRAQITGDDEAASIAREFNTMLDSLDERDRALVRSEARYRSLIENIQVGVIVHAADTRIQMCNPMAQQLLGLTEDQILGKSAVDPAWHLVHEDGSLMKPEEFPVSRAIASGKALRNIIAGARKGDATIGWFLVSADPMIDDSGAASEVIVIFIDITARKRADEELRQTEERQRQLEKELIQSQKLESLGTLASGVAHDFNNILGIIVGYSSLLLEQGLEPGLQQKIESIEQAALRGASLVKQLLTLARKGDSDFTPVALNDVVKGTVELVSRTLPKTMNVVSELEDVPTVRADLPQMHQILLNLCLNARDAMPGGGTIKISTHLVNGAAIAAEFPRAHARQYVLIRVQDSGSGMDEETRRRIFEPFFTTKGPGEGSGLGLTLVYSIVANHQGFIGVDSSQAGAVFRVYLPVDARAVEQAAEGEIESGTIRGGKETVLVIEDEELLTEVLVDVLSSNGYTVLTAMDGETGVALFREKREQIDLVLTDLGLPRIAGDEVVHRIKAMDAGARIIVASGFIDPAARAALMQAGVAQIIQKPFTYFDVLQAVRNGIDGTETLQ